MDKLLKPYNPLQTESRVYERWEKSGFFNPDATLDQGLTSKSVESFSILLPPPNVTGTLHVGHAAMLAIEDIMVRYHRMAGKRTLWLPGTDHAAIATQSKVEEQIYKKDKKTRHDIGRELFLKMVEQYAAESHDTIVHQIRSMGASVDWSREAYTLDDKRSLAVRTAFKRMYDAGLIYRGARIINWDPKLGTTVSDDEIEWREETVPLYYLKYGPFTIATARPETKFGDKYVVMHPDDQRYKKYEEGETIELEWINGPVKATIIKDTAIDMEFGSGVMTITPWHDSADFEIALRHGLDKEQIIDFKGKLLPIAGDFTNMHISKARPLIVEKLNTKGLIDKVEENYIHRIAVNGRGGGTIEPQIKEQWFVAVNKRFVLENSKIKGIESGQTTTLKELMKAAVLSRQIEIIPDRFEKVYFHWIENLRDWCISRQIWYGHRIPVWYRSTDAHGKSDGTPSDSRGVETYVGIEPPEGEGWEQDPDTLDTWFSSGLWTFSTLGWPEHSEDLRTYHPTSILETGYDILFFWVARMILMSGFLLGDIPFRKVYLHGLVRDEKGRKMSKSLGNIIDPLTLIGKYGADALRMALIIGTAPGNDSKISDEKTRGYKHFANKVWNATRFVVENTKDLDRDTKPSLGESDQKRIEELDAYVRDITGDIDNLRFYLAAEKIYHYFWHTFADIIIEECKERLRGENAPDRQAAAWLIHEILRTNIKILHPFMPFLTEEVWSILEPDRLLMVEQWPQHS